jgi:hypothetical protein
LLYDQLGEATRATQERTRCQIESKRKRLRAFDLYL